jgi:hypothetical protein
LFGGSLGDDDSHKVVTGNPGTVSHTGSRAVRLKDNSDASRIYTVLLDVSFATPVEVVNALLVGASHIIVHLK